MAETEGPRGLDALEAEADGWEATGEEYASIAVVLLRRWVDEAREDARREAAGMDAMCANCRHFEVLDDRPRRVEDWFGTCELERGETAPCRGCGMIRALGWAYDHGRHGGDDCERPDEWFEGDGVDE